MGALAFGVGTVQETGVPMPAHNRVPLRLSRRAALGALALPWMGCSLRRAIGNDGAGASTVNGKHMTADQVSFGTLPDGRDARLFTLRNASGTTLKFTNYGLIVTELHAPDRQGRTGNIVLGFDNLPRYLQGHPFFGAIAGRYANRIAKGRFSLDGRTFELATNNGKNHLHGGLKGFDKQLWKPGEAHITADAIWIELTHRSPDGDEGYPGNLDVTVRYTLTRDDVFRIDYTAVTDQATVLNLTNHSYFNLAGGGDVLGHELLLNCDRYTPVDDGLIPVGELASVKGTPLDFTQRTPIGARQMQVGLAVPGYDHNFVINRSPHGGLALAARVVEPNSGRVLECHTTEPAVQLYTFNFAPAEGIVCNGGVKFGRHGGFCLETQHFPDSPNHPHFPSVVLRPGQTFRSTTEYRMRAA